jgi:hypothetical protein
VLLVWTVRLSAGPGVRDGLVATLCYRYTSDERRGGVVVARTGLRVGDTTRGEPAHTGGGGCAKAIRIGGVVVA